MDNICMNCLWYDGYQCCVNFTEQTDESMCDCGEFEDKNEEN